MSEPQKYYFPNSIGGEPMELTLIANTLQANRSHPAQRAMIQIVEAYAHETLQTAAQENLILTGQATPFLMAWSFLSAILSDVADYTEGRIPDPQRPRPWQAQK